MELWSADHVCVKGKFEKDWGVLVDERGLIEALGPRGQLVPRAQVAKHYSNCLMLPALTNPHQQSFYRIFRGLSDFHAPFQEIKKKLIWPLSEAIDAELIEALYRVVFAEQLFAGIGTLGEFFFLHQGSPKGSEAFSLVNKIIDIAVEMGVRLTLVYVFFDQGSRDNTTAFIQSQDEAVNHFHELRARCDDLPLIDIIPGIHGLENTSAETMIAAAELAEIHNCKLHIQLAERQSDLDNAQTHYGTSPLRALQKIGLLNHRAVIVGGNLLDSEELALMRKLGCTAVVCPSAALAKGDRFPNLAGLLANQIPFAIGSSSLLMTNGFSVPAEIKLLEFMQRGQSNLMNALGAHLDYTSLWELGSIAGAAALGLDGSQFMPGAPADWMLIEIAEPAFRPTFNHAKPHFMNQLIFGWGDQVAITHLMINGRMVMANRTLDLDLTPSYLKLEQWSEALLRFIEQPG